MRKNVLIFGHNDATQFIDIYNQYTSVFDPAKFEVTVVFLTGKECDETKQRLLAEKSIFLDIPKKQIRMLKIPAIKKLLALCRDKKFDVVICHRYKPTYIMIWVSTFYKIPALICVMHELGTMSSIGRRLLMSALARKNVVFAGVSNTVRDDMRRDLWFVPKDQVITLYNMIDIEQTKPQLMDKSSARQALRLSEHDFVFGQIARLAPNKNQACLIQAFSRILPVCPNAKLIIMGDGDLESALTKQIESLGLTHAVTLTGFIPNGFRYMPAFDCFVLSSIQEAFGRVLLEAMIAKLPIIATKVHGIPEVTGNVATLIPPADVDALVAAMLDQFQQSSDQRQISGDVSYLRAIHHFSISCFKNILWEVPVMQGLNQ